jgi:hypothetical protein
LDSGFGKRAMQALLGFGYLLTVLHEKHLGGHIEFTASALTAAAATTPARADSHIRHRNSFPGSSSGSRSMLAGLRKAIQECPSLSPGSLTPVRRSAGGFPASAFANQQLALNGSGSSPSTPLQQQQQQGGPFAAAGASAGGGMDSNPSFEVVWERINSPTTPKSVGRGGAVHGLSLQLSLSAPLGKTCSSSLARVLEEEVQHSNGAAAAAVGVRESSSVGGDSSDAAAADGLLCKEPGMGRSGNMEKLLDEALQQLAEVDLAAVGLSAAAATVQNGQQQQQQSDGAIASGGGRIESPFSTYQNLQLQEAELEAALAGEGRVLVVQSPMGLIAYLKEPG